MYVYNIAMPTNPTISSERFDEMYTALRELGLVENEQRLYVVSLQQGPTTVAHLAELLGIPRPNVYKVIDGLMRKGLIDPTLKKPYTKKFSVLSPSVIIELLNRKRSEQSSRDHAFLAVLPSYMGLFQQGASGAKIHTVTGRQEFKRLFQRMYEEANEEISFCGSMTRFHEAFGDEFFTDRVMTRIRKNVRGRALLTPDDRVNYSAEHHEAHKREVRYLENAVFDTSFHLFSNKVVLWQPHVPMAIVIEDTYLTQMMHDLFRTLWDRSG